MTRGKTFGHVLLFWRLRLLMASRTLCLDISEVWCQQSLGFELKSVGLFPRWATALQKVSPFFVWPFSWLYLITRRVKMKTIHNNCPWSVQVRQKICIALKEEKKLLISSENHVYSKMWSSQCLSFSFEVQKTVLLIDLLKFNEVKNKFQLFSVWCSSVGDCGHSLFENIPFFPIWTSSECKQSVQSKNLAAHRGTFWVSTLLVSFFIF